VSFTEPEQLHFLETFYFKSKATPFHDRNVRTVEDNNYKVGHI